MNIETFQSLLTFNKNVQQDFLNICEPLFKFYRINTFGHTRVYQDHTQATLVSNTNLFQYWIEQQFPIGLFLQSGCYLASELGALHSEQQQYALRTLFNVDHCVYVIENAPTFTDIFMFSTTTDNRTIIHTYLNDMNNIRSFLNYYRNTFSRQIKQAQRYRLTIRTASDLELKLPTINLPNASYFTELGRVKLTKKELKCSQLMVQGKTAAQIGDELFISKRTVEMHIENIKTKFNCRKVSQLAFQLGKILPAQILTK